MVNTLSESKKILLWLSLGLLGASVAGIFGDYLWILDLFSHFKFYYAAFALGLFAIGLGFRIWTNFSVSILVLVFFLNSYFLLPQYGPKSLPTGGAQPLKAISINLSRFNKNVSGFKNYIFESKPDILFLFELTPRWAEEIADMKELFPHAAAILQNDEFGIAILSRLSLEDVRSFREQILETPWIEARAQTPSGFINLVATHPFPPVFGDGKRSRDNYLNLLAETISGKNGPTVLCGDLNTTPWSNIFRRFVANSGLTVPKGFGAVATWPVGSPIKIPIDHCLTSQDIVVSGYRRGPDIGSDHFPIEMEFSVP